MFEFESGPSLTRVPGQPGEYQPTVAPGGDSISDQPLVVPDKASMEMVPVRHGFGIDEFLEDFEALIKVLPDPSGVLPTLIKKAAECKIREKRLYSLKKWTALVHEKMFYAIGFYFYYYPPVPLLRDKALLSLDLIIDKLNPAFDEAVEKPRAETKVPDTKVYDFGLKKFLSDYSDRIPEKLKDQFEDIHHVHSAFSSQIAILEDLIGWVRNAQKEFQFDIEALKMLEAIKFRLRMGLSINSALENGSQKTELLIDKRTVLNEKLKAVTDGPLGLNRLEQLLCSYKDKSSETREHGVFLSPKEVSAKAQELTGKKQDLESALKKNSEEINHQNISKSLIALLEKLSESDSAIEMPIVTCERKAEKALVDKIQKYIKRHDERVKSFSLRRPPVFTSSTESETTETPVESEEIFPEESPEEKQEQEETFRSFMFQSRRRECEKFGLSSPLLVPELAEVTVTPNTEKQDAMEALQIQMQDLEKKSKELRQVITEKNKQLTELRNNNVEQARSVEVLKTQMFRSLPEVEKPETVKNLKNIDQSYQQYKDSEHKDDVIKQVAMTRWDRICEKIGLTLSARHATRKTEVEKYFKAMDAHAQLEAGLASGNDTKIALSLNRLNIPQNYLDLWESLCKKKNELSKNAVTVNRTSAEIKGHEEKLKELQAEHKKLAYEEIDLCDEQDDNLKNSEPESSDGFSLEV